MPQTVLCVPGIWKDRDAFMGALVAAHGARYMLTEDTLLDTQQGSAVELQFSESIETVEASFRASGVYSDFDEQDFAALRAHRSCVFLIDRAGGTIESSALLLAFGQLLLACGGLAVRVESCGKAHSERDWNDLDATDPEDLFWAYVMLSGSPNRWASTGMHSLGHPDIAVRGVPDSDLAATLVDTLGRYLLLDAPDIQNGQTFGLGPEEPAYRMTMETCTLYPEDDLFHNPFGVWTLVSA